jgi:hypothetical protein
VVPIVGATLLPGRKSRPIADLPTGIPEGPGTFFESSSDVSGLFFWPWELGLIDVEVLRQLLLAKSVPNGREVAGTVI